MIKVEVDNNKVTVDIESEHPQLEKEAIRAIVYLLNQIESVNVHAPEIVAYIMTKLLLRYNCRILN